MKKIKVNHFPLTICRHVGIPEPMEEHRFHPVRKWRFDYSFVDVKIAVEIEGAAWVQGRHTRGSGFVKDVEKYNAAIELGWTLLRYQPGLVDYQQIKRVYDKLKEAK